MEVTLHGGPRDGEVMVIADNVHMIHIPRLGKDGFWDDQYCVPSGDFIQSKPLASDAEHERLVQQLKRWTFIIVGQLILLVIAFLLGRL
jgi:hypothetical protein